MTKTDFSFLKNYAFSTAVILLALMTVSFFWFSYNKQVQVQHSLKMTATALRESGNIDNYQEFVGKLNDVRVTILDVNGNVLAENRADMNTMENHACRPEFAMSQENYFGVDVRKSETTGKKTIYIMTRMPNGVYLRLAQDVQLSYEFILWLFAPIVFLSFCLAALVFVFAKNKQAETMRREFVANVSHELKTPLTSIKGFAELTTAGLVSNADTIKEYQQKIVAQSDRLLATINDILLLSRMESVTPAKLEPVDTRAVSEQVKDALKMFADEKGIVIQVSGTGKITAEPGPIYQVIYNLVENGIKYGNRGGFVRVVLDGNKITVADNGIGIPQEDIGRVFERFYRVDKSRSSERGGTGLGLAIVKHAVLKYGGTISLKSIGGTQVYIEFKD